MGKLSINVDGVGDVWVDDSFKDLSPEQQQATVDEIAASAAPQQDDIALSDVPGMALQNLPQSAGQFASDVVAPFADPIGTAKGLGNVALGGVQKLIPGEQSSEKYADAVGEFFANRYGGWEELKRTMATDPVGFMGDLATVFTGGGTAAVRAPGVAGKVGQVAQKVGQAVDPIALAGKATHPLTEVIGALGTHTGGESLRTAARAGYAGGDKAEAFRDAMRGSMPIEEVVEEARRAVSNLRAQRGQAYRQGMAGVGRDVTVLDMKPVHDAVARSSRIKQFKGIDVSESTTGIRNQIRDQVERWAVLEPSEFHTAEGLDALKQSLGDIRDNAEFGTPARKVADEVYQSVRGEIVKQAPEYAKVMKGYEEASEIIKRMEKELSLNPKASVDTALRKLTSILRNNANTNYGARQQLADILVQSGATHLMEKLSGQAMSAIPPRGLGRAVGGATVVGGVSNPYLLGALPFQSPRLMGEAAYAAGVGGRYANELFQRSRLPKVGVTPRGIGLTSFQAGRLAEER